MFSQITVAQSIDLEQLEDYVIESMQESLDAALEFQERNPNLEIEISLEDASQTRPDFFKKFSKFICPWVLIST